jgi:hypothetical protein
MQLDCQVLASLFYEELKATHSGRCAHRAWSKARIVLINAPATTKVFPNTSRLLGTDLGVVRLFSAASLNKDVVGHDVPGIMNADEKQKQSRRSVAKQRAGCIGASLIGRYDQHGIRGER